MGSGERVGLVLAGGGARGAYAAGALSVLLPELERRGQRPTVIVGTSTGAINAALVAASADRDAEEAARRLVQGWSTLERDDVFRSFVFHQAPLTAVRYLGEVLGVPGIRLSSLLDPAPLRVTLDRLIDWPAVHRNVRGGALDCVAVAASDAANPRSVVFVEGATSDDCHPLGRSSTCPPSSRASTCSHHVRPDFADGALQLLQATLVDPLIEDIRRLGTTNLLVRSGHTPAALAEHRGADGKPPYRRVPYMFIAPHTRGALGDIASSVFARRFSGYRGLRAPDLAVLSRLLGGQSEQHGELISYVLFEPAFHEEIIALGRRDAQRWFERVTGPDGPWYTDPIDTLPDS